MNVEWRCKTEQSTASSSMDQWMGAWDEKERIGKETEERGEEKRIRKVPEGVMKSLRLRPKSQ